MDRIAVLTEILDQSPNDAFARYGLAMEYANSDRLEQALTEFGKLLSAHPDYTAGYFMAAQALAKAERVDEAKKMLNHGITSARQAGNQHALSEMQAMLDELGEFFCRRRRSPAGPNLTGFCRFPNSLHASRRTAVVLSRFTTDNRNYPRKFKRGFMIA